MKNTPLVSIILPTHNRAIYLPKAIKSVSSQTFHDFELIVINDGSIDETSKILSQFKKEDERIRVITNTPNLGLVKSLNKGIGFAKGKYIARIDDDDIWSNPQKLIKQVHFLETHPDYVMVGAGVIRIDAKGKEILRYMLPERDEDIRRAILQNNTFAHSNVLFRKYALEEVSGYNEDLNFSEDWDLWMKFSRIGKFYNFQEYFLTYVRDKQNKMNDNIDIIRSNAKVNIMLRWKYRTYFPGFFRAYFFGLAHYFYSFIPFRKVLHIFFSKFRRQIFGQPAYRYYDKK